MYSKTHVVDGSCIIESMPANDGIVPVLSQAHPRLCSCGGPHMKQNPMEQESCSHARSLEQHLQNSGGALESGKWYVTALENLDHLGIVVMPRSGVVQKKFFNDLYCILKGLRQPS